MPNNDTELYWKMLGEEYKTLREESRQISVNMFVALQIGTALVAVVMAAGFSVWGEDHTAVIVIFFVLVPLLGSLALFLWLGEMLRFKRVGDYLCFVEAKVGKLSPLASINNFTGIIPDYNIQFSSSFQNIVILLNVKRICFSFGTA